MEKVRILLVLLMLAAAGSISADMHVRDVAADMMDLTAATSPRYSADGRQCALFKIECVRRGLRFAGDGIVGDVAYDGSEYAVYLLPEARSLTVSADGCGTVRIVFADYGVAPLVPKAVYHAVVELPAEPSVDDRVRLYKPVALTAEQRLQLDMQAADYVRTPGANKSQLKALADKGSYNACVMLGSYFVRGYSDSSLGVSAQEVAEGEYLLRIAAEYGESPAAAFALGEYYYAINDFERAFEYYFSAHSAGNVKASNALALMMAYGLGTEKDTAGALDIWREIYWKPNCPKSVEESIIRQGASILAVADFSAPGIREDAGRALARRGGFSSDMFKDLKGKKMQIPLLYNAAVQALDAEQPLPAALYLINAFTGTKKYYPRPMPGQDTLMDRSVAIVQTAAAADSTVALDCLARMYSNGVYFKTDKARALELYTRGAELGVVRMAEAASELVDGADAFRFRQKAYDLGSRWWKLLLSLGDNYAQGVGVKKNPQKALELYEMVAKDKNVWPREIILERIRDLKVENNL